MPCPVQVSKASQLRSNSQTQKLRPQAALGCAQFTLLSNGRVAIAAASTTCSGHEEEPGPSCPQIWSQPVTSDNNLLGDHGPPISLPQALVDSPQVRRLSEASDIQCFLVLTSQD